MAGTQKQMAALKPEQILEIVMRQRWTLILPVCFFLTIGFLYTITADKVYQAATTVLIQPQKVPEGIVQSIVSTDHQRRIATISKLILSRTNLEKIIKEFNLYQEEEEKEMYLEDKITDLRGRILVEQNSRDRSGTEAFSISFYYRNSPELVMKVVNKLATIFMDENLKVRESQAIGTSEFLESELKKIKEKLEAREKELADYRTAYMGGLPDELETNLRTLDRLQLQYSDALNTLRENQNAIAILNGQISRLRELSQNSNVTIQPDGSIVGTPDESSDQHQYDLWKKQLDDLLLKYTEKHPEVIKTRKKITSLKEKLEKAKTEKEKVGSEGENSNSASPENEILFQHEFNLKQLEKETQNIKTNLSQIEKKMEIHQQRVEDTPQREQELQSIRRDYNNIRESYNSLLARRLEAELAVNMEKKQKGEQFRIVDYAKSPEKPISPDVKKNFMLSLILGLGLGGGIIFLLELLNPAIRTEEQIKEGVGLPILASIPPLEKPWDRTKKRIELVAMFLFFSYISFLLLLFIFLNMKGIDKALDFLRLYINVL